MGKNEQLICSILRGDSDGWPVAGEWSASDFFATCRENGVTSVVYACLQQSGNLREYPEELRDKLKRHFLQAAAVELSRTVELGRVLGECTVAGIFPLLLKGAALSYTHYPSPGLRERCDSDLFFGPRDIEPFLRVMARMGYAVAYPVYKSHQFTCIRPHSGFPGSLDVHWRISNRARFARVLDFSEASARSLPLPQLPGARVLASADALLLACIHLAGNPHHDPSRLIWIYDLHLLATAMEPDELLRFAKLAVAKQVQVVCLDALEKSRQCFATSIPAAVLELLATPVGRMTFVGKLAQSNLGLVWNDLLVLPQWRQKLALLHELFIPPRAHMEDLYGKTGWGWLPWLYVRHIVGGLSKRLVLR